MSVFNPVFANNADGAPKRQPIVVYADGCVMCVQNGRLGQNGPFVFRLTSAGDYSSVTPIAATECDNSAHYLHIEVSDELRCQEVGDMQQRDVVLPEYEVQRLLQQYIEEVYKCAVSDVTLLYDSFSALNALPFKEAVAFKQNDPYRYVVDFFFSYFRLPLQLQKHTLTYALPLTGSRIKLTQFLLFPTTLTARVTKLQTCYVDTKGLTTASLLKKQKSDYYIISSLVSDVAPQLSFQPTENLQICNEYACTAPAQQLDAFALNYCEFREKTWMYANMSHLQTMMGVQLPEIQRLTPQSIAGVYKAFLQSQQYAKFLQGNRELSASFDPFAQAEKEQALPAGQPAFGLFGAAQHGRRGSAAAEATEESCGACEGGESDADESDGSSESGASEADDAPRGRSHVAAPAPTAQRLPVLTTGIPLAAMGATASPLAMLRKAQALSALGNTQSVVPGARSAARAAPARRGRKRAKDESEESEEPEESEESDE